MSGVKEEYHEKDTIWFNGGCGVGGLLWAGVAVAELDPVVKCQADKVKAGGKLAQCLANEQAKELKGKPFDTQECEDKYYKAIAEADEEAAEKGAACGFVDPLCQTDMTQAQASLATCNTDLGMCNTDLAAWEASAFVPQTGQTTTFAAGDDGEVQAGVAPPVPHFTDNFDGTFTDTESVCCQDSEPMCCQDSEPVCCKDSEPMCCKDLEPLCGEDDQSMSGQESLYGEEPVS